MTRPGQRGAMQTVKCKRCKAEFEARVADVNRGWGKFCSKSCKAKIQTAETGISGPDYRSAGVTVKQMKRGKFAKSKFSGQSYQRFDLCRSDKDREDLRRNPRIIEPLYDAWGECDGETFFANFSNEEGTDI